MDVSKLELTYSYKMYDIYSSTQWTSFQRLDNNKKRQRTKLPVSQSDASMEEEDSNHRVEFVDEVSSNLNKRNLRRRIDKHREVGRTQKCGLVRDFLVVNPQPSRSFSRPTATSAEINGKRATWPNVLNGSDKQNSSEWTSTSISSFEPRSDPDCIAYYWELSWIYIFIKQILIIICEWICIRWIWLPFRTSSEEITTNGVLKGSSRRW